LIIKKKKKKNREMKGETGAGKANADLEVGPTAGIGGSRGGGSVERRLHKVT